jgi:hypothetical protein
VAEGEKMELWRQLEIGDKIRLIEIPPEFLQKGYYIHRDTMRVTRSCLLAVVRFVSG